MPKQNSMDVIRIKYGANLSKEPADDATPEEKRAFEEKKRNVKEISLPEFLKLEADVLSPEELAVQEALHFLYDTNAKDPPLFEKFPSWRREQPLIVDCTSFPENSINNIDASYHSDDNVISFETEARRIRFVSALAHELKHAELYSQEVYNIVWRNAADNLGQQQVRFLMEAQAYIFGNYVQMLYLQKDGPVENLLEQLLKTGDWGTKRVVSALVDWMNRKSNPNFWDRVFGRVLPQSYKELEQKLIPRVLNSLYRSTYKLRYDNGTPIERDDVGLRNIPDSFLLDEETKQKLLQGKLKKVPKKIWVSADRYNRFGSDEENRKILQALLKQEDEDGNSPLSRMDFHMLIMDLMYLKNIKGMVALLKRKNKKGRPWLHRDNRTRILEWLLTEYPVDQAVELLKKLQNSAKPVFSIDDMAELILTNDFWKPKTDSSEAEEKKFFSDKERLFEAMLGGWDKDMPRNLFAKIVEHGCVEIVEQVILSLDSTIKPENLRRFATRALYNIEFGELIVGNKMKKRTYQMMCLFLDLKDKEGKPVIDAESIKEFLSSLNSQECPVTWRAIKRYQKKHQNDKRFKGSMRAMLEAKTKHQIPSNTGKNVNTKGKTTKTLMSKEKLGAELA